MVNFLASSILLSLAGVSAIRHSLKGSLASSFLGKQEAGQCQLKGCNFQTDQEKKKKGFCINTDTHQFWFFNFENPWSGFLSNMAKVEGGIEIDISNLCKVLGLTTDQSDQCNDSLKEYVTKERTTAKLPTAEHAFLLAKAFYTNDLATFKDAVEGMDPTADPSAGKYIDPKAAKARGREFYEVMKENKSQEKWELHSQSFLAPIVKEKLLTVEEYKSKFETLCNCGIEQIEEVDAFDVEGGNWGLGGKLGELEAPFMNGDFKAVDGDFEMGLPEDKRKQKRRLSHILTGIMRDAKSTTPPCQLKPQ
uniref:NADAR domain-containing protein n=1 Tax=Chromera velia CCMP2878 TaxID=1169474 RepID=A0A0G4FE62_9ALVE|eukprot:Cvel_3246.t1-p1 / transcript=Cvel_3246.t1 / gene=Cvel_3246 / organism=Chromera_velia_CCMP2878 / gene_product=hypothetical protein / transcript_product=hypothetical protein / location=Cvel_scaffold127:73956-74873(-) / protein_length=306 / sequence_SO=supercontig / SO=protein_coding / is_pseudo=false